MAVQQFLTQRGRYNSQGYNIIRSMSSHMLDW